MSGELTELSRKALAGMHAEGVTQAGAALDLAARWRAHENDDCAAPNIVLAVFGYRSPAGRIVERYLNPSHAFRLEEFACEAGLERRTPLGDRFNATVGLRAPRSDAARKVMAAGLRRGADRRRVPMSNGAWAALALYLRERTELLQQIAGFWREQFGEGTEEQRAAERQLAATKRLLALIRAVPS